MGRNSTAQLLYNLPVPLHHVFHLKSACSKVCGFCRGGEDSWINWNAVFTACIEKQINGYAFLQWRQSKSTMIVRGSSWRCRRERELGRPGRLDVNVFSWNRFMQEAISKPIAWQKEDTQGGVHDEQRSRWELSSEIWDQKSFNHGIPTECRLLVNERHIFRSDSEGGSDCSCNSSLAEKQTGWALVFLPAALHAF